MTSRQAGSEYAKKAHRAVSRVGVAVRTGRLVRQPCADCGAEKVQAHHHNGYDPEHELDVVWLCRPHHMARHGRQSRAPWERGVRTYMDETRPNRYRDTWIYTITSLSSPRRLFEVLGHLWDALRTDEERAYAAALINRLAETREDEIA